MFVTTNFYSPIPPAEAAPEGHKTTLKGSSGNSRVHLVSKGGQKTAVRVIETLISIKLRKKRYANYVIFTMLYYLCTI